MMIRKVVPVPQFQEVQVLWKGDPRWTVVLETVHHTGSLRVMKKEVEGFVKYRMKETTTARRDHGSISRGPSTHPHFDRFQQLESLFY